MTFVIAHVTLTAALALLLLLVIVGQSGARLGRRLRPSWDGTERRTARSASWSGVDRRSPALA